MNYEKYLPVGTVVLLKNAKKRVMIIGFAAKGSETGDVIYDYIGCLYPEGVISSDKNLLFNHDQIARIFYIGYIDEEWQNLHIELKKAVFNASSSVSNATAPNTADNSTSSVTAPNT